MPSRVISRLQYTTKIGGIMQKEIKKEIALLMLAKSALEKGKGDFHIEVEEPSDDGHRSVVNMTGHGSVYSLLRAAHTFINAVLNVHADDDMSYEDVLEVLGAMNRLSKHYIIESMNTREETP